MRYYPPGTRLCQYIDNRVKGNFFDYLDENMGSTVVMEPNPTTKIIQSLILSFVKACSFQAPFALQSLHS